MNAGIATGLFPAIHYNRPPFDFVIVGKGSKPGYKLCRLEGERLSRMEQEYSHKHLNKYAVHVPNI